jgi:hypothetical protein
VRPTIAMIDALDSMRGGGPNVHGSIVWEIRVEDWARGEKGRRDWVRGMNAKKLFEGWM